MSIDVIRSKLAADVNEYTIISDIIRDYKSYGYNTKIECYDSLVLIFTTDLSFDLDDELLTKCMQTNHTISTDRSPQTKFRQQLIDKYKTCVISGCSPIQCDACHIVPVHQEYNFDPDNGLLLSAELHRAFDQHLWSIDIETMRVVVKANTFNDTLTVNRYDRKQLDGNLFSSATKSYLAKHYAVFLTGMDTFDIMVP